jgi:ribulose-phosphate 3-epimerase
MNIYPAILTGDLNQVIRHAETTRGSESIDVVQIDIIDGIYRDNLTVTPADLVQVDWGELQLDLHLMTNEPIDYVHEIVEYKSSLPVRAVIAQVERMSSQVEFLEEVKRHQWRAGLSLDYFTPLEAIDDVSWDSLDIIMVMGNESGFHGRQLQLGALQLVQEVRREVEKRAVQVEVIVDVGVNEQTIGQIARAGADGVAVGSSLWQAEDFEQKVSELQALAGQMLAH